ncbi:Prolow-density lipoprotein receptor-related protein 1 [Myotis brandtii]|uniref:Prolow-density lipoprotein receptor-related protein 1 n=1 Tax=Myotis brandtii TaxID=109478 RepID=S7P8B8_MYOBR|nr:Prolow-density lipoprotein receptor-related protein 1 [Myotis brandtii]
MVSVKLGEIAWMIYEAQCNMTRQAACGDRCIPVAWLCNGERECPDGTDEQCGSSECRDAWELCDGPEDCAVGSDNAHCPRDHCLAGQWQCKNKVCVMETQTCDGINDCGDSSDEDVCGKSCSLANGGCEGQCSDASWGVRCSCGTGWQLQPDGQSCGDIDECSMAYSPCDQLCHNTPGSYSCGCTQGYQLYNGTRCQVIDGAVRILIAADRELGVLDQRTGIYETLIPIKSRPTSVAYDLERNMYFWVDEFLNMFVLGKPKSVSLYPELKTVNSVSLDWFTGQLYWASSSARVICAGLSDGRGYVRILEKDLVPEQLIVFPVKKYLYWVNRGQKGMRTIDTAGMDGSDRKVLAVVNMEDPVGLTLDHVTGRLYWISAYKEVSWRGQEEESIETVNVDGSGRHTFPQIFLEDEEPVGLAVFENSFIWTNKIQLFHTSPHTPKERVVLLNASIFALSVLHKSQQPKRLQSLSLLKNRTYTLNKTWSDDIIAAHEPYLVTMNGAALVLWNRKTLEPFSMSKEPHVKKIIILAENQEVPDPGVEGAATITPSTLPPPRPLLCTRSSVPCRNGKECISREYLCDGERDCQDGSDEENCSHLCNRPGIFQCLDGSKCLEEKYHCDGAQQCSDGSDELDCWKPTEDCSVLCDNKTRCVPKSWLCDGNADCSDKEDEQGCIHEKCSISEFRCKNGQCISYSLHCDGNRDCLDRSDEEGCPVAWPQQCPSGEVKCPRSGECVLTEWICDHDLDCKDGSDEKNCHPQELRCGSRQWSCASADQCVPDSWRCDGQRDCRDGSDEAACAPEKCRSSEFQCRSSACLHLSLVCDGKEDCADGSDEGGQCSASACGQAQCSHTCYPSPRGPICACEQGFELKSSSGICEDVDECRRLGGQPCSQTCINTEGSYRCTCHPGYLLEPDGHTCKATGTEPILLVAIQFNLLLYGLRSLKEDILAATDKNLVIFSIDYDLLDQKVFWTELGAESIKWISMDAKKKGTVVKGIKSDCMVVDWIGRNLYWTDGTAGQILAIQLTAVWRGKPEYTIVLDDNLNQPRSLALDPLNGLMYWSEIGGEPHIEQAGMDGSRRKVLINKGLGWPTSIVLDQLSWKIFWSDDKFHCIGSANLDGTGISMLQLTQIKSPFSVAVLEDEVFWSETKTRTVQRMKKMTGKNRAVLIKRIEQPYGLKVYNALFKDGGGRGSSIDCASMDGIRRKVLWQKSQVPVGLTFSDSGTRVYWADTAQITKVWYSKAELSENRWFQVDLKIVDLKVYSKLSQQGAYPDKTHSTLTLGKLEAGKRVTPKAAQPLQAAKPPNTRYVGPEETDFPVRKTLIPSIPDRESKTSENNERGKLVQPKDPQEAKHLPCGSDFCNGRGICTVEGELRRCSCPMEYGGDFCEEAARGPGPGYIALSFTITLPVVLLALGALVYFRKERERKRNSTASSRNLNSPKEHDQEEENLMSSETFVNEAYDEQECNRKTTPAGSTEEIHKRTLPMRISKGKGRVMT